MRDVAGPPSRRDFVGMVGGALAAMAGASSTVSCRRHAGEHGAAIGAKEIAALMPRYEPLELVPPDIRGRGPLPNGYLRYPSTVVRATHAKPGSGGSPIRTMTPWWGSVPPGLGRNSYVEAINRELGVTVNPSIQDGMSYADKVSAMLGARDVPDVLCAPAWEIDKIPRFSDAVRALFVDLTEHLSGNAVEEYRMLATLPTSAWQSCVWNGRLAAIPFPTNGPFPLALFYRKDIATRAGVAAPQTIDELRDFGRKMTDPARGVWAFGDVFNMVQMIFRCPGTKGGWRRAAHGGLEYKYEIPEYKLALEFTTELFRSGMVHPDLVASRGADSKQLFCGGKIVVYEDGLGAWQGAESEQLTITPGFDMQPIPLFSATGGEPLAWGSDGPIFYTFVKKKLGTERTREILRVLDWCAAPFGSFEYELNSFGVEGKHFTHGADGSPVPTDLGRQEIAGQFNFISGRAPAVVATADTPRYVSDLFAYFDATIDHMEEDLFRGIKLTPPSSYSKLVTVTEDKLADVVRGRRPLGDLRTIVAEWRSAGGDETRAFLEKTLADSGR